MRPGLKYWGQYYPEEDRKRKRGREKNRETIPRRKREIKCARERGD